MHGPGLGPQISQSCYLFPLPSMGMGLAKGLSVSLDHGSLASLTHSSCPSPDSHSFSSQSGCHGNHSPPYPLPPLASRGPFCRTPIPVTPRKAPQSGPQHIVRGLVEASPTTPGLKGYKPSVRGRTGASQECPRWLQSGPGLCQFCRGVGCLLKTAGVHLKLLP